MMTHEQHATSFDPLDGFLISGAWTNPIPPRSDDLRDFLASPPIPDDPRSASDETGEAKASEPSTPAAIGGEIHQEMRPRSSTNDDWSAIAAIAVERPEMEARIAASPLAPRAIAAEAAALAVAEPRALVAPSDVLDEVASRPVQVGDREDGRDAAILGSLLEDGGLVDPSTWFSGGLESTPPRDSVDAASWSGFRPSRTSTGVLSPGGDRGREDGGQGRDSTSASRVDRLEESSSEAFEEIETRLSRVAARLEGAVDRIEFTASSSQGSRMGGFRGRVGE